MVCGASRVVRGNEDSRLPDAAELSQKQTSMLIGLHDASLLDLNGSFSDAMPSLPAALAIGRCNRDINEDRHVDSLDLQRMVNALLHANPSHICLDMNDDQKADEQDIRTLVDHFLFRQNCLDFDQDDYEDIGCGGSDRNDGNASIYPGAIEDCSSAVDEDCSRSDSICESCEQGQIQSRCLCGDAPYDHGFCCSAVWQSANCESNLTQAIIANHETVDLSSIPISWIDQIQRDIGVYYGHASHGGQITGGLQRLSDGNAQYAFAEGNQLPNGADALNLLSAYNDPVLFFTRVQGILDANPSINVAMFSWCGEAAYYDVNQYISQMETLEAANSDVTFVYMTGHAQEGHNAGYGRHKFNEALRQYAREHNKVLFDFADLDVWYGNDYTPDIYDWDDYGNKPLLKDIPLEHPDWSGDDCGHASWASCENKAKALWWLLARIAGWEGN